MTSRNSSVSPTSKMVSASSLGVLWRRADSTMEIMRSRKDSPGLTVICTTSQSDSTRVPPVTEEKSPPASRITGADSPVMALSSTERSEEHTSELQSPCNLVCRLLLEKKKNTARLMHEQLVTHVSRTRNPQPPP